MYNLLSERIKMNIKWTHRRYGKDYTVATLSKLYLTVTGIIIQSLKLLDISKMSKLRKRADHYGRTGRP